MVKQTPTEELSRKSFPAFISDVKAEGDLGIVKAYVSVMGNVDKHWEVIQFGAFTKTIAESAHKIRVLDNHNYRSTEDAIAKLLKIEQVNKDKLPPELIAEYPDATGGLYVEFQFMLDEPTDKSAKIFRRIKAGVIDEYSIGFRIIKGEWREVTVGGEQRELYFILEVDLKEFSPVIFAANTATMTVDAKNDSETLITPTPDPKSGANKMTERHMPHSKAIPNYRESIAADACKSCEFYKAVTAKNGFCLAHQEAVGDKFICDDYVELKIPDTIGIVLRSALVAFLENQVGDFHGAGILEDDDMEMLGELLPTLVDTVMNIIPSDVLGRELPNAEYEKPKSSSGKSEAEPSEDSLTSEDDAEESADILRDLQRQKAILRQRQIATIT